ncbi:hypothetical protein QBC38DRAFT_477871 [Podospora fimiseda]|uniref:Uncharacterized protein n=1 Tax=Podospora fimiseda TaxID=252190 RepID=A0AAN7BQ89_9PEZI|nr:hypothetical protein QBC38DRAFT_477871 [Podospora fimiseda]
MDGWVCILVLWGFGCGWGLVYEEGCKCVREKREGLLLRIEGFFFGYEGDGKCAGEFCGGGWLLISSLYMHVFDLDVIICISLSNMSLACIFNGSLI